MKNPLILLFCFLAIQTVDVCAKDNPIKITWNGKGAKVSAPRLDSLSITNQNGRIVVQNQYRSRKFTFVLSGTSEHGSFRYQGSHKATFELKDLTLQSTDSIPLCFSNSKKTTLVLQGQNTLTVDTDTLYGALVASKGNLYIEGKGSLNLTSSAVGCRGIKVGKNLTVDDGQITIYTSGSFVEIDTNAHPGPIAGAPGGMGERPDFGGMPDFAGGDRPDFRGQRPDFGGKRPDFGNRPPFGGKEGGPDSIPGRPDFHFGNKGRFPMSPSDSLFHDGRFPMSPSDSLFHEGEFPDAPGGGGFPGKQKYNGATKAIRVKGTITINGGTLDLHTTAAGAEGLEGKKAITINGGEVRIDAQDDAINSGGPIIFNGGIVRATSRGNDAVDCNVQQGEAIVINGGDVEAVSLIGSPEEGFDSDFLPLIIRGGRAIGIGGAMGPEPSVPTEQSATCPTIVLSLQKMAAGDTLRILAADGQEVFLYTAPEAIRDAHAVLTCPQLQKGQTYRVELSGTLIGETTLTKMVTKL